MTPTSAETPPTAGCSDPGRVETGFYPSQIAGPNRAYRIYLPPCYGEDGRLYPTLYLFHGNIHSDSKWDELGVDEAANELIAGGQIPPMLIVMPDGGDIAQDTSGGPFSFEGVVLSELIPFIEATYCAWGEPASRAIGGLSRGGYWALEIAFRYPDHFVSGGGHSAALLDVAAGPDLNPQVTGLTNDLGDLRIYLDIGSSDYVRSNTLLLHEEMAARGVQHTWVLNEGLHDDAYWSAHVADYLRWYGAAWPLARQNFPLCELTPVNPTTAPS